MLLDAETCNSDLPAPACSAAPWASPPDDPDMMRLAASVARLAGGHRPAVYWTDFILSALTGYAALALAIRADPMSARLVAGLVSVLALYRAGSFMHELTHIKDGDVPGFRTAWNLLAGIPLMMPSFMYEGVHTLHHARNRYGTDRDPEYLPLARQRPPTLALFVLAAALAPLGFLVRFGVLAPLSLLSPRLRRVAVQRFSALAINPDFRREPAVGAEARRWRLLETATAAWAIGLLAGAAAGVLPLAAVLTYLAVLSCSLVLNQVRTLVAHLWESDGEPMSLTAQYADSVNVPPPALLPALWAPVGLRYHALHHLLPGVPYHALGKAHRALVEGLPAASRYHQGNHRSFAGVARRLLTSSLRGCSSYLRAARCGSGGLGGRTREPVAQRSQRLRGRLPDLTCSETEVFPPGRLA
jgi:fatty acid desaturase